MISFRSILFLFIGIIRNIMKFSKNMNGNIINENISRSTINFIKNKAIVTAHKIYFIKQVLEKLKPKCIVILNQDLSLSQIANQVAKKWI